MKRSTLLLFSLAFVGCSRETPTRELRVCSDPNNLPFSNQREEGFENRIAQLIAADLDAAVKYTWRPQRRGFIRNTLGAGLCDVIMGMPAGAERVLTTRPYYRSTYVFIYRKDRHLAIGSLDDPELRQLKIGVQLIGDDYANTPPVHALSRRGIVGNLVGFTVFGDYSQENPPARIVDAVVAGQVDIALVWGPLAGYFAKRSAAELVVVPVSPAVDPPALRYTFAIAVAVRQDNARLRDELDGVLLRRQSEIRRVLEQYGIPLVS
jgi:quinoprotein dehydrogenase-associated probable ABC transporter substrate-binding protein